MNLIQWNESFSVNNLLIDNQHRNLFKLTNNLILNSNAKVNSEIISETLHDLILYAKTHFKDEEELLKKHHYPKFSEHKTMHENFIYEIAMFCEDVVNRKTTVAEDMINYLVNWIFNHTCKDDQDYKNYI
jgi:hemerythrin